MDLRNLLSNALSATRAIQVCVGASLLLVACSDSPSDSEGNPTEPDPQPDPQLVLACNLNQDFLFGGGASRDGIPALTNPPLVSADHTEASYINEYIAAAAQDPNLPEARVVGLFVDGTPIAVPHNILWWHEIVNADLGGRRLAVSYCPLTGSPLVFDLTAAGAQRLGVSGLIFRNNLVMFDDVTETLWFQMCARAGYGPREGDELPQVEAVDMLWDAWKSRHPNTLVVSSQTGFDRDYASYPYVGYETNDFLLFGTERPIDPRRPAKERVLGIPDGSGGIALPFGLLASAGGIGITNTVVKGATILVLWDEDAQAAAAFYPRTTDGADVSVRVVGDKFMDRQTDTTWDVDGRALSGPLAGSRLQFVPGAIVAYWFAWAAFHPDTRVLLGE